MNWFILTLASIFFLSSYYFLSKKLLNQGNSDPRFYGAFLQLFTGIVGIPIAIITGFKFEFTFTSIILLILMAIIYTIGPSLYYTGLKKIDLSETTILDSVGVIYSIILGAIFLSEGLSWEKVIGGLLILLAVVVVSIKKRSKLKFSKYELLIIIAPIFYSLGAILDNRLVQFSTASSYLCVSFLVAGSVMLLSNFRRFKTIGFPLIRNRNFMKTCLVNSVFLNLTYTSTFMAYSLGGEVSKMYPISQIESVIVPLIGILILKERTRIPQKLIAAVIAFIGVLILGSG